MNCTLDAKLVIKKRWAPHVCGVDCAISLSAWYKVTGSGLTFGVPMIWRELVDHSTHCYFCLTDIQGMLTHIYSKEIVIQLGILECLLFLSVLYTLPGNKYLYRPKFPLIFLRIYLLSIESTH